MTSLAYCALTLIALSSWCIYLWRVRCKAIKTKRDMDRMLRLGMWSAYSRGWIDRDGNRRKHNVGEM
jgi:hypothetical protein